MTKCGLKPTDHAHFSKGCGLCALELRLLGAGATPRQPPVQSSPNILNTLQTGRPSLPPPSPVLFRAQLLPHSPSSYGSGKVIPFISAAKRRMKANHLWTIGLIISLAGLAFVIERFVILHDQGTSAPQHDIASAIIAPVVPERSPTTHPSFDCAKATKWAERVICGDTELSALDNTAANLYWSKHSQLTGTARDQLTKAQVAWIRTQYACETANESRECLKQGYATHIAALSRDLLPAPTILGQAHNEPGRDLATTLTKPMSAPPSFPISPAVPPATQEPRDTNLSIEDLLAKGDAAEKEHNWEETVHWYRIAADKGNLVAIKHMADKNFLGEGTPEDFAEAVRLYRIVAAKGDVDAMYELAFLYEHGPHGVHRDLPTALDWYRRAAAAGSAKARQELSRLGVNQTVGTPYEQKMSPGVTEPQPPASSPQHQEAAAYPQPLPNQSQTPTPYTGPNSSQNALAGRTVVGTLVELHQELNYVVFKAQGFTLKKGEVVLVETKSGPEQLTIQKHYGTLYSAVPLHSISSMQVGNQVLR